MTAIARPQVVLMPGLKTDELWTRYRKSRDPKIHNQLLVAYLYLTQQAAARIHRRLPREVDVDDLSQQATFGLSNAISSFNPEVGVKFATFAMHRINGAIYDYLRSLNWAPRLTDERFKAVEAARAELRQELGREATDEELAKHLKLTRVMFTRVRRDAQLVRMTSLNAPVRGDADREATPGDIIVDSRQKNPMSLVQQRDLKALITKGLTRAERLIIILYYYEEMTMKEVGQTLELSESRVSQMHSSILQRLKARLGHRARELEEDLVG